jgi:hypothetical protein
MRIKPRPDPSRLKGKPLLLKHAVKKPVISSPDASLTYVLE